MTERKLEVLDFLNSPAVKLYGGLLMFFMILFFGWLTWVGCQEPYIQLIVLYLSFILFFLLLWGAGKDD